MDRRQDTYGTLRATRLRFADEARRTSQFRQLRMQMEQVAALDRRYSENRLFTCQERYYLEFAYRRLAASTHELRNRCLAFVRREGSREVPDVRAIRGTRYLLRLMETKQRERCEHFIRLIDERLCYPARRQHRYDVLIVYLKSRADFLLFLAEIEVAERRYQRVMQALQAYRVAVKYSRSALRGALRFSPSCGTKAMEFQQFIVAFLRNLKGGASGTQPDLNCWTNLQRDHFSFIHILGSKWSSDIARMCYPHFQIFAKNLGVRLDRDLIQNLSEDLSETLDEDPGWKGFALSLPPQLPEEL